MKISSFSNLNKNFQSYNSLSSMETIDSPVQIFEKSHSKKIPSRPLINSIISKEDLRQVIAQDSFSSKNSLRRLDSYNLSDNGSCAGIKSERNITIPVRAMQQQQKPSHKKNIHSAAPQEVFLDSSADEDNHIHMAPQYPLSQYASQQAFSCIDDYENESECESDSDEYNIWDNSEAEQMGINIENSEIPFEFCQLFYIRSQLYQANKVNKNNILEEVQVISNMCKKQMNILRSNKLIDSIEKNYHLTLKKNAIQISKLKLQKTQQARPLPNLGSSTSQKQTPKAFRISQYPLFHTPNKSTKQSSIPNIADDIVSPIYSSGRQLLAKSTTNFKISSCESIPMKSSIHNSPSIATIKKVNLKLNSPQSQRPASKLGQERFISINKQSIYNSLGKAVSHSKFYPMQEINV